MQYADNNFKMVAVLNRKIAVPQLMNALGHMTAGLIAQCDPGRLSFLRYEDADGSSHPAISRYPFIVLSAKNSNQVRTLREAAIRERMVYNDFAASMLGSSAEQQLHQTKSTKELDLDYFGICLFGEASALNALTRKFSLFSIAAETQNQPRIHDPLMFGV
jgi:hypothetical protein